MEHTAHRTEVPIFIKPEELHLFESAKFIDVREPNVYAQGHVKNAVNAYDLFTYLLPSSKKEDIEQMTNYFQERLGQLGIGGQEHLIVYEQSMDNQYGASCRGLFILKHLKHHQVSVLEGGLDTLVRTERGAQLITTEATPIVPCHYKIQDSDVTNGFDIAGRDDVLHLVSNKPPNTHLIDVRDVDEWNGVSSSPYGADFAPRKGRIPNAVWIEWYNFHELDPEKNVVKRKSVEGSRKLLTERGIKEDDEIIIYCFKGSRVSVALMCLKEAGFKRLKNYFGSWNEWSRDFDLPIDDEVYSDRQL